MNDVFLLEDDAAICELVVCALQLNGVNVSCFNTVADFAAALERGAPKLAILDVMLPDGNGFEVLKAIKKRMPALQCIMLSALSQETDKVKGLNLGADDYIAKPFGVMEFSARVAAALRRVREKTDKEPLQSGNLCIDREAMTATLHGKALPLNAKELKLLVCLVENEGKVLPRDKLLDLVWGYEVYAETRTVDNHVARLRKLGLNDNIVTVFGSGYKYVSKGKENAE